MESYLTTLPALWAIVMLASILRAFTGFGFALAAVPVFALLFDPKQAVVLSGCLALVIGLIAFRDYRRHVPVRELGWLTASALPATALGALLLSSISASAFNLAIGVSVLAACGVLVWFRPQPSEIGQAPVPLTLVAGTVSGLMNGALAIPGPPVVVYALATHGHPMTARALLMAYFTLCAVIALGSYSLLGLISQDVLIWALCALPALLLGDWLGNHLFTRYGTRLYRRVAIAVLVIIGCLSVYRGL